MEFEDEVVEVQKAPPPRAEPQVEVRAAPRSPSPQGGRSGSEVEPSSGRILQYSKKQGGSGVLGDDLGQMSGGKRAALVLLVVAVPIVVRALEPNVSRSSSLLPLVVVVPLRWDDQ